MLIDSNSDKLKEECGVFGIFDHIDASALTALGLHSLQHRGQESCGIVSYDGKNYFFNFFFVSSMYSLLNRIFSSNKFLPYSMKL